MPPFTSANVAWPEPTKLFLQLLLTFALAISAAWLWGRLLVECLLPVVHPVLGWFDNRFNILFLGIDHTAQDTVIRLRVNLNRMVVVGMHVTEPRPDGWLEVTTTVGAMLQPLVIGVGLAGACPGKLLLRCLRMLLVALFAMLFMLVDIPLTLHAYVWDMFLQNFDRGHLSPLMAVHGFLHGGGRLGVGVMLGALSLYCLRKGVN